MLAGNSYTSEFIQVTLIQQLPHMKEDMMVYIAEKGNRSLAKTNLTEPVYPYH